MQLVIAEKPSAGRGIAAILGATQKRDGYLEGSGYIVSWCIGHLVGLADVSEYDAGYAKWRHEDLPIVPAVWKYSVFSNKKTQFSIIKKLMCRSDVESIICATDAGREGELIFRLVYQQAGCRKPFCRLWISSMEESAIRNGFDNLQDGRKYDALYESALCRAKADFLIGINATRAFSTVYGKTLNIGRVQSPTLAMIVQRHKKITGFEKEKYHMVRAKFGSIEALSEQISEKEKAERIKADCSNKQAVCVSLIIERKITAQPKLFDLTSLQRGCNRLFGMTAKQTLDTAQKLYERKLITYPRTDSRFLTSDMAECVAALVPTVCSFAGLEQNIHANAQQLINDKKVTDHHAIIPTAEIADISVDSLDETAKKVLLLIASRFICAMGGRYEYDSITAVFECGGHTFTAGGTVTRDEGWKGLDERLNKLFSLNEKEQVRSAASNLSQIAEGQSFNNADVSITEHYTKPPAPYTEDTLLSAMERAGADETDKNAERKGLGTPATRASIIEKLVKSGFVERKGKQLIPTGDGIDLVKVLPDTLTTPALTAEWENHITLIAGNKMSPEGFMRRIEDMARNLVAESRNLESRE